MFLSRKLTSPIGFVPFPSAHVVYVFGSVLNTGAGLVELPAPDPQFRKVMRFPFCAYAFSIHTYGGVPTNRPIPPRSWLIWSPVTSRLNPRRGENWNEPVGVVWPGYAESIAGAYLLSVRKLLMSPRTPAVSVSLGVAFQVSWA